MQSLMKIRSFVLEILHVDRKKCFLQINVANRWNQSSQNIVGLSMRHYACYWNQELIPSHDLYKMSLNVSTDGVLQ
jgi:hypothetical protein